MAPGQKCNDLEDRRTRTGSSWLRCVRCYLKLEMKLWRINLGGELQGFGPPVSRDKLPLWSRLMQLFYFYFTLKLLANLALQYQYNRLTRGLASRDYETGVSPSVIHESIEGLAPGANQTTGESEPGHQEKRAQLGITIERMQLIGNAYYEFGGAVEALYLVLTYISVLAYLLPLLYVTVRGPVSLDVVQLFFAPERHWELTMAPYIERQANRYIKSSANYLMTRQAATCLLAEEPREGDLSTRLILSVKRLVWHKSSLRELELAHERDARQVAELLAQGELVPANRRLERIEWLAQLHGSLVVVFTIWSWITIIPLLAVMPRLTTRLKLHHGPRDLLFQAELLFFCLLLNNCFIFYMVLIIVTAIDHIELVAALGRLMASLTERLASSDRRASISGESRKLICLSIQYELLKGQLRSTQREMNFVSAVVIVLMLTMPVLARLYLNQMPLAHRLLHLAAAVVATFSGDLVFLPFCWLHARCLCMFRARSRLLAAIDAHLFALRSPQRLWAQSLLSLTIWRASHDEHPVCLLRREQHAHEMAVRNFAVDAFFMRLTYSSLLGVHFWCGLLLAPLCLRETAHALDASDNLLALIFQ